MCDMDEYEGVSVAVLRHFPEGMQVQKKMCNRCPYRHSKGVMSSFLTRLGWHRCHIADGEQVTCRGFFHANREYYVNTKVIPVAENLTKEKLPLPGERLVLRISNADGVLCREEVTI